MQNVILQNKEFRSKYKAVLYFRDILHRNKIGKKLYKSDHIDVGYLLTRHPKYPEIENYLYLTIKKDLYGGRCFCAILPGNKWDTFSYIKCINAKDDSNFQKFYNSVHRFHKGFKPRKWFVSVAREFITTYNIDVDKLKFDNQPMQISLVDKDLQERFIKFLNESYGRVRI